MQNRKCAIQHYTYKTILLNHIIQYLIIISYVYDNKISEIVYTIRYTKLSLGRQRVKLYIYFYADAVDLILCARRK